VLKDNATPFSSSAIGKDSVAGKSGGQVQKLSPSLLVSLISACFDQDGLPSDSGAFQDRIAPVHAQLQGG
jgi:hypothetical protein